MKIRNYIPRSDIIFLEWAKILFSHAKENHTRWLGGKEVFFCMRYENSKGEAGPWGIILSAFIP